MTFTLRLSLFSRLNSHTSGCTCRIRNIVRAVGLGFAATLVLIPYLQAAAEKPTAALDIKTDKARYAPGETVRVQIECAPQKAAKFGIGLNVELTLRDRAVTVVDVKTQLSRKELASGHLELTLPAPKPDYHGYRLEVSIRNRNGEVVATGASALDVSSDWRKFPRYGYLAHFNPGAPSASWIDELAKYHVNGLQFYDFQYKHHIPAPPPDLVNSQWHDVAGRVTSGKTLRELLQAAKNHNMMTMAYNASYSAYADAFRDGSGAKLEWAAWPDKDGPRTERTVKSFQLPSDWSTDHLLYMNQDDPRWQQYIGMRMQELFAQFPFDGWHVDSFGAEGAFDFNGNPIDFFGGFWKFANAEKDLLKRPILLNTVGGGGQKQMANSSVEFVYSELWPEDHATYRSIADAAEEIHSSNPDKGVVFAAYIHKGMAEHLPNTAHAVAQFNEPAVLLADATIFASGAAHLELGDGDRMLSGPYFPADTAISLSPNLRRKLRDYYDFLVAYENYLRDELVPSDKAPNLVDIRQSKSADAGAVWTITKRKGNCTMMNLINLTGQTAIDWRDDGMNYREPPTLRNIKIRTSGGQGQLSAGWASPDIDSGAWHPMEVISTSSYSEIVLPELRYWTLLILQDGSNQDCTQP